MKGYTGVPSVGPVHVGEERDAAGEETQEDQHTIQHVKPAVLQSHLDQDLSSTDKGSTELCNEEAANEEISQTSPEIQRDRQEDC